MTISNFSDGKILEPHLMPCSLFGAQKSHFRKGKAKNIKKHLLESDLKLLLVV
jgi:hypothetical protein